MAIIITDECINCGACEPECPNNAIYEGGIEWSIADGTTITGTYMLEGDVEVEAQAKQAPVSDEFYFSSKQALWLTDKPKNMPFSPEASASLKSLSLSLSLSFSLSFSYFLFFS